MDAVVADFIAGAAEQLVVEGAGRGDLLWVEGQGSIVHPQYSGVTLGLMHGSAPHGYVLCHQAGSTEIEGCPGHPIPPLRDARRAARAAVPAGASGQGARGGRQHTQPRRGRGAVGYRRGRGRDRAPGRRSGALRPRSASRRRPRRASRRCGDCATGHRSRVTDPRVERLADLIVGYSPRAGRGRRRPDRRARRSGAAHTRDLPGGARRRSAPVHRSQPRRRPGASARGGLGGAARLPLAGGVEGDGDDRRARDYLVGGEHSLPVTGRFGPAQPLHRRTPAALEPPLGAHRRGRHALVRDAPSDRRACAGRRHVARGLRVVRLRRLSCRQGEPGGALAGGGAGS